jgi:hypothetical protein
MFIRKGTEMVRKSLLFTVIAALTASSAQAAMLTNIQGGVSINAGGGYQPVAGPAAVVPGERIRTGDGSADIVYDNGQTVHVGPNQVVLVSNLPPSAGPAPDSGGGLKDVVDTGIPPEYLIAGAVVVGGGIACGLLCGQNNHHHPASP